MPEWDAYEIITTALQMFFGNGAIYNVKHVTYLVVLNNVDPKTPSVIYLNYWKSLPDKQVYRVTDLYQWYRCNTEQILILPL